MGKKQHQKDKLYLTTKEWKEIGGHKDDTSTRIQRATFKRLPFTHCALSFLPFEDPVCTPEGHIFDLTAITPYLKKHGINPVTGKKLPPKDLIVLNFAKDSEGNFRCPVTYRVFTPTSVIVAIRQTGNVYSMEAVEELNLKRNHLKDLLTDTPFQRKDIITLQDPNDLGKFNMETYHHVQFDLKTKAEIAAEKKAMESPQFYLNRINNEAREALLQLEKQYVHKKSDDAAEEIADSVNAAHFSQGLVAAGLTSTVMEPVTLNKAAVLDEDIVKYQRVTKNGYVQIMTNFGPLNLELYCKHAPRACENFIVHCRNGYYKNTKFHRLIKHFMLQGGDPTGTGKGGESIWGKPFKDEFTGTYSHDSRGVLSMANRGSDTNGSQFFITFRPCKHLDKKHTIFGKLVGGGDTFTAIEKVETDETSNAPLDPVIFLSASVFVDPFEEASAAIQKEREAAAEKVKSEKSAAGGADAQNGDDQKIRKPKAYGSGIGKYIKPAVKSGLKRVTNDTDGPSTSEIVKKRIVTQSNFGDFSSW
ncbi:cyclophilin type peptidyl-prolyl cis-trans isomerase/CLD domain-containing protein [Ditylenchus destructor]|uniref:RING-type E3 ubiquitin-protein ligase PPIL2 n=1 Tax=Ditylenchus destructor TaxID=166010 RepID=A0AAD4NCJ8_9BILA|nr:cyclophilin type peptidyl-prolyl cis-trans isomerase/CLD domain-containing protein [Ditylenchus destructor]